MAKQKTNPKRPPATTIEGRENQLISLAIDLVEKKLRDGTASSQILAHFLKLGSTKNELELEKLKAENELAKAKADSIKSAEKMEKMYAEAITAFKRYRGEAEEVDFEEYDDYEEY